MVRKDYSNAPESDMIVRFCEERFNKGMGTTIFVVGLSGTGKSSTCLRLSELLAEEYEVPPQILIVDSLMKFIGAIKRSSLGDIIVVEEVSVLFPSRRSMSSENVSVNKIFDTVRKKQLIIICNFPIWPSVDSHMRTLGNVLVETLYIDKKQQIVVSKTFRLQPNPQSGKIYKKYFKRKGRTVHRTITRKPNSETWDKYEKEKDSFMDQLYSRLEHEALKKEAKLDKEMMVGQKRETLPLTKRELEVHMLVNTKGMSQTQAGVILGLSKGRVSAIVKQIEKKTLAIQKKQEVPSDDMGSASN